MDIGKALTFITEDEKWIEKLAIGTGLTFFTMFILPIFIMMGYSIRLLQNVRDQHPTPLPEWNQWAEDLKRGFKLFLVTLIWSLPIIILNIPMAIGGFMIDSGGPGEVIGSVILACGACIIILYAIFVTLSIPGLTIAFAKDEEIRSALQLTEIWHWTKENLGSVIIVTLVWIAASFIISMVGMIAGLLLCGIGLLVTVPLGQLVTYLFQYHLFGQLAQQSGKGHPVKSNPVWEDDGDRAISNMNVEEPSLPQTIQIENR